MKNQTQKVENKSDVTDKYPKEGGLFGFNNLT